MPELPEVETIRAGLERLLINGRFISASHDTEKSFPNAHHDVDQFLIGASVTNVRRRAKVLIIDLDTNYSLVIHLKMTGQIVYVQKEGEERFGAGHPNESLVGQLPDKSTRVTLDLENAYLYFNDQRKFGWMRLMPTIEIETLDFFKKVGPEPLSAEFNAEQFISRLNRRKNTTIKAALLDQTVVAGIGNIYADESLWASRIHPATLVKEVSEHRLKVLFKEIQFVLSLSIEKGGSTNKNYVNAEGQRGSYLDFAKVFRRENLPCPRCGTTIQKTRVAGRGTHLCPKCQQQFGTMDT
jgi:formamidopyrimidine-DNA glycosylase